MAILSKRKQRFETNRLNFIEITFITSNFLCLIYVKLCYKFISSIKGVCHAILCDSRLYKCSSNYRKHQSCGPSEGRDSLKM